MKQLSLRFCCLLAAFALFRGVSTVSAQQSLDVANGAVGGNVIGFNTGIVNVTMTTTAPTQGWVIAVCYDTTKMSVTGIDIPAGGLPVTAELVSGMTHDPMGGATLGVVLDANAPFMGQTIAAGTTLVGEISVMSDVSLAAGVTDTVPIKFQDGTFGSPTLDNILVQGGLSLGAGTITLGDGDVTFEGAPDNILTINGTSIPVGGTACAEIELQNANDHVQGFVLAIAHDPGLVLEGINIGAGAAGVEFFVPAILNGSGGGTVGAVMDFNPPFLGQTITPGTNIIAEFCYSCVAHPVDDGDPMTNDNTSHPLSFVDGVLGTPALDNVVVVAGLSLGAELNNGAMECEAAPLEDTMFACGELDSEGNLVMECIQAQPGEEAEVCFFWKDATDNVAAFQLGICWDNTTWFSVCGDPCFDVTGTILDAVGAEFVNCSIDNANGDMIVGILLDFLPPFNRQTVPPTADWLKIGSVTFCLDPMTPCGEQNNITFCDTADGSGSVPTHNLVTVWREVPENSGNFILTDIQGFPTMGCCIEVNPERIFCRGNCNNDPQCKVTITDAATILAVQFQGVPVGCLDACDVNDDGKINLADAVFLLNFLFKSGPPHNSPAPPSPFPTQGVDPTVDDPSGFHAELDCADGRDPCAGP